MEALKYLGKYAANCITTAAQRSFQTADAIFGGIGIFVALPIANYFHISLQQANDLISAIKLFGFLLIVVFTLRLIMAPFVIWMSDQKRIRFLEQIDTADLEHLLYGFYLGDTFIYKSEITLCRDFKGKFQIEQMHDNYVRINIRAPRNSTAKIRIGLHTSRQQIGSSIKFFSLGRDGKDIPIEDIYAEIPVWVDESYMFSLKFICDDDYIFLEDSLIRITVESWVK